jgi:hypothetical protein
MAPRPPPRPAARWRWLPAAAALAGAAAGCLAPTQELLLVCISDRGCPPGQGCGDDQLCHPRSELDAGADGGADGGTADAGN